MKAAQTTTQRLSAALVVAVGLAAAQSGIGGCAVIPVSVGNPIPGMTTIAVAPFFNLSAEPTADGRRFAYAYYSELQKTGNYQVIPVGVVEMAIRDNDLDLSSPADAVKLAAILEADAVVVGAITEYDPYYPPQLGLHVQWFSPREWAFFPGCAPMTSTGDRPCDSPWAPGSSVPGENSVIRAQSDDHPPEGTRPAGAYFPREVESPARVAKSGATTNTPKSAANLPTIWPPGTELPSPGGMAPRPVGQMSKSGGAFHAGSQPDAIQPVMSYTRFFDGADERVIDALKGYYALRDDKRSGSWEAYLHRSDDFLRFTAHQMVLEMLSLHGAVVQTEKVSRHWNWR
jgi:hypothetical protein